MDLEVKNKENIKFMIEQITTKLQLVNTSVINVDDYPLECYDDLHELYRHVKRQSNFSVREMEAIAQELGNLREID